MDCAYTTKIKTLAKKLYAEYKVPLWTGLIVGLLAHMYMFMNKIPNLDDIFNLFSLGAGASSGRWGISLLEKIFPPVSIPWINGLAALCLFVFSSCLIIHILQIRSASFRALTTGLIVSFPSLTGTMCYMFTSVIFALSFLLAVLSVYLLLKKNTGAYTAAFACLIFSLSIYQSYITVASTLLLLVLLRRILTEGQGKFSSYFKTGLTYLIFLLVSVVVYYAIALLVLKVTGTEFNDYVVRARNGIENGLTHQLLELIRHCGGALLTKTWSLVPTTLSTVMTWMGILASGVLYIRWWKGSQQTVSVKLLSALVLCLVPISINSLYLVFAAKAVHTLTLYSFVLLYVLMIELADTTPSDAKRFFGGLKTSVFILLAAVMAINIYVANNAYLALQLQYEHVYSFYTGLASDVRGNPDFTEKSKLGIIGEYENETKLSGFQGLDELVSFYPGTDLTINTYSRDQFIHNYIGFDCNFATDEEKDAIAQTAEFKAMPSYPYNGSIAKIGDCLVVKFSDIEEEPQNEP